jgi:hypothetical protein
VQNLDSAGAEAVMDVDGEPRRALARGLAQPVENPKTVKL